MLRSVKRRVKFTYPPQLVTRPVIYELGTRFGVITNIRRADIDEKGGWVILEMEGAEENVRQGVEWVLSLGIRVDPVPGNIIEG